VEVFLGFIGVSDANVRRRRNAWRHRYHPPSRLYHRHDQHNNVYSLTASAILAVALVAIVQRMRWFELEIFGILATYLNHFFWLRPIIEPMGLLCFYGLRAMTIPATRR
jgi:hypothetical protein